MSTNFEWKELKKILKVWINDDRKVVVMGLLKITQEKVIPHRKFAKFMKNRKFLHLVENKQTLMSGGLIDHIYVNQLLMEDKPFYTHTSVMHSGHDKLVLHIPKKQIRYLNYKETSPKVLQFDNLATTNKSRAKCKHVEMSGLSKKCISNPEIGPDEINVISSTFYMRS